MYVWVHMYMMNASAEWNDGCFFSCWRIAGSDAAGAEGGKTSAGCTYIHRVLDVCGVGCDVGVGCAGEGKKGHGPVSGVMDTPAWGRRVCVRARECRCMDKEKGVWGKRGGRELTFEVGRGCLES